MRGAVITDSFFEEKQVTNVIIVLLNYDDKWLLFKRRELNGVFE